MIKRGVLMLIILVLLTAFSSALAEDPVKLKMDLSNNRPEAGEAIHVAITVINAGEQALSGPATLYTPDGKRIRELTGQVDQLTRQNEDLVKQKEEIIIRL